MVDHADPFHVRSPTLHAGIAISKDDREIGMVGMFMALTVNKIPCQSVGVSYGCRNCRLLVQLACSGPEHILIELYTRARMRKKGSLQPPPLISNMIQGHEAAFVRLNVVSLGGIVPEGNMAENKASFINLLCTSTCILLL